MSASTREIEIKLAYASAEAALEALARAGARPRTERAFERNRVYDLPDRSLARNGLLLRLRECGGRATLTFKAPIPGDHRHKVRDERETGVTDPAALAAILESLGYRVAWCYEKYRTILDAAPGVEASVDETPIGCWVELEGRPDAIDRFALALGFTPDAYERGTYRDLLETHAAAHGVPAGDLRFDGAP